MSRRGLTIRRGALSEGDWVTIPGPPVGKGRPRLVHGRVYTPARTRQWESVAKAIMRIGWSGPPIPKPVPVRVDIRQIEARPKRFKGPDHRHWCPLGGAHPDVDNVVKLVLDSLNGLAYEDDSQVCHPQPVKLWAASGESPRVEIRIATLDPDGPTPDDQLSLWGGG